MRAVVDGTGPASIGLGRPTPAGRARTGAIVIHSGARTTEMALRPLPISVLCLAALLAAAPASAQYGTRGALSDPATGERYTVEIGGFLWAPTPTLLITSESLGIVGNQIDFVEDFDFETSTFRQLKAVLRPGRKHKLRFEYTPIRYSNEARLNRTVIFNGQRFDVTLPVLAGVKWNAMRFGYEWDFLYRDRGFLGLLLEAKYTDVEASLENVLVGREFVRARAPIPAIGLIGRAYPLPNLSITGELSGFRLPNIDENYRGSFYDFDIYGTLNFTDHFGVQGGYRSLTVFYQINADEGDLKMRRPYFGGVVRF